MKLSKMICIFSIGVVLLSAFSVIFLVVAIDYGHGVAEGEESTEFVHRLLEYNPQTGETRVGFANLPFSADEDGIFYHDVGWYSLISNFDTDRYKCTGSCFCSDGHRRSASTSVFRSGVLFLVAALSSLVALEKAKDYYEKECVNILKDECAFPYAISSNVDECSAEKSGSKTEDERVQEVLEGHDFNSYSCEGRCLDKSQQSYDRGDLTSKEKKLAKKHFKKEQKNTKCRMMRFAAKMEAETLRKKVEDFEIWKKVMPEYFEQIKEWDWGKKIKNRRKDHAIVETFFANQLHRYCDVNSLPGYFTTEERDEYKVALEDSVDGKEKYPEDTFNHGYCEGWKSTHQAAYFPGKNPSIKCQPVDVEL